MVFVSFKLRLTLTLMATVVAVAGGGAHGSVAGDARTGDVTTKFVWKGNLRTKEQIWLVSGSGNGQTCHGKIAVTVEQLLDVQKADDTGYPATEVSKGIWETHVAFTRVGKPHLTLGGSMTCVSSSGSYATSVSSPRLQSYAKTGMLTLRYDARKMKLEVVPSYGRQLAIAGKVVQTGSNNYSGVETVVKGYGLPRLELHPQQEPSGDLRAHADVGQKWVAGGKKDANVFKIKAAGFVRTLDAAAVVGGNGFLGSPITTFLGFQGHAGGPSLGAGYHFEEKVVANLAASVFGSDSDGDGVNDAADPNAFDPDADNDGFPDYWEAIKGTDPTNKNDHPPGHCCPGAPDSDHDGHSDPQEVAGASDPNDPSSVPNAAKDSKVGTTTPPPPPSEDWYGFTIRSNRCVYDGENSAHEPTAHARVGLHMWVITKSGFTTHLVTNMRWRARLESPIGLHYSQVWVGGHTPYLTDGNHSIDETIDTVSQIRDAATDGGQTWKVHVQLTWDRPSLTDLEKNVFLPFLTSKCPPR